MLLHSGPASATTGHDPLLKLSNGCSYNSRKNRCKSSLDLLHVTGGHIFPLLFISAFSSQQYVQLLIQSFGSRFLLHQQILIHRASTLVL